jgi:lysophospholipase L1-like esterase
MRNVFFVGDELVAGHGDPKALGWTGRVAARTLPLGSDLVFHALGVPGETTGEMTSRWDTEALRRLGPDGLSGSKNFVVFGVGRHDLDRRVSPTMTRLNLANALDRASALGFTTMLAGPPPIETDAGMSVAELAGVCEEAASRRAVPYVDMYGPLARHDQWIADLAAGNPQLPKQAGYGLMAWLVLHSVWHEWLGVQTPDDASR